MPHDPSHSDARGDTILPFSGERIVPEADNCEPNFARKMYQEHSARYLFASQLVAGKRVLDVGCGVGYGSRILAERGAASVVAFDLSGDAIKHARRFYSNANVEFRVASADAFEYDERFDVVVCFELIEHVERQSEVIDRIRRHLAPDGILVISTPRALAQKRTDFHTKEFSLAEFRALLSERFEHVEFYFENNHFASVVQGDRSTTLEKIEWLSPEKLTLSEADYFVAIASPKPVDRANVVPQGVFGDDEYVTLLERDVAILRGVEADQSARLLEMIPATEHVRLVELERERSAGLLEFAEARIESLIPVSAKLRAAERLIEEQRREIETLRAWTGFQAIDSAVDWTAGVVSNTSAGPSRLEPFSKRLERATERARDFVRNHRKPRKVAARYWKIAKTRLARQAPVHSLAQSSLFADVIFFNGCTLGESQRYRIENVREALATVGVSSAVIGEADVERVVAEGVSARTLVVFRAVLTPALVDLIDTVRAGGGRVFYDIDDLVFEPESIDLVRVVRDSFTSAERSAYKATMARYRECMLACGEAVTTTEYLASRAVSAGVPALVVPNTINEAQIARSESVRPRRNDGTVRIGYFSGSATHSVDFAACESAVLDAMARYPQVRFVLVGHLELGPRWKPFADRVERHDFQPYLDMLDTLAGVDVNLAPLEIGNPYCEGKSELKIFEAGLVRVPTIASATSSYRGAIEHGVDGLLAADSREWSEALDRLIVDSTLLRGMGERARQRALGTFSYRNVASRARDVLLGDRTAVETTPNSGRMSVAFLAPELIRGSGGHRNIIRVAHHLQRFGHDVSLYFAGESRSTEELRREIRGHFYPFDGRIERYEGSLPDVDVLFATAWFTVDPVVRHKSRVKIPAYFVQDFEAMFMPMGSGYVLAENTYRQGLYHITSGPWCEHLLRDTYHVEADHFLFPVDRDVYYPRPRTDHRPTIVFFGRPEMPRRCFEIGVGVLEHVHRAMPDVEIIVYGSGELASHTFPFAARVVSLLPTIDDLATLYSNADLGIAFSTTNPSLVPYEMMACGLPVVDFARPGAEVNFGNRTDIALLADPMPEKMAAQIIDLLKDPAERRRRARAGLELVASFPDEPGMARRVESLLLAKMEALR